MVLNVLDLRPNYGTLVEVWPTVPASPPSAVLINVFRELVSRQTNRCVFLPNQKRLTTARSLAFP
jgi:hypothetical protein